MAIDPRIAMGIQPIQLNNPLEQYGQFAQLQGIQQRNRLAELTMQKEQQEVSQQNALAKLYQDAVGADGSIDRTKVLTGAAQGGLGARIPALQKGFADQDKALADAHKTKLETGIKQLEAVGQIAGSVRDPASFAAANQQLAAMGIPTLGDTFDPAKLQQISAMALSRKDQLAQEWKAKGYDLDVAKFGESQRHNQVGERMAAGNLAVSQANLGLSRERLNFEKTQPKGQIVQTDQGTMLVDPRTGQAQPATFNGAPLQPKLKDLPAPVAKSVMENSAALRKIDQALAEVDAYPDAFGAKNYLGDAIRQRTDPKGVNARAFVSDIGSLIIHDRSGAAVTAAEMPRLQPFIPTATDDAETVKKKLARFKQEYEGINNDIRSTYTREQGYKTSPSAAPAGGGIKFLGFE